MISYLIIEISPSKPTAIPGYDGDARVSWSIQTTDSYASAVAHSADSLFILREFWSIDDSMLYDYSSNSANTTNSAAGTSINNYSHNGNYLVQQPPQQHQEVGLHFDNFFNMACRQRMEEYEVKTKFNSASSLNPTSHSSSKSSSNRHHHIQAFSIMNNNSTTATNSNTTTTGHSSSNRKNIPVKSNLKYNPKNDEMNNLKKNDSCLEEEDDGDFILPHQISNDRLNIPVTDQDVSNFAKYLIDHPEALPVFLTDLRDWDAFRLLMRRHSIHAIEFQPERLETIIREQKLTIGNLSQRISQLETIHLYENKYLVDCIWASNLQTQSLLALLKESLKTVDPQPPRGDELHHSFSSSPFVFSANSNSTAAATPSSVPGTFNLHGDGRNQNFDQFSTNLSSPNFMPNHQFNTTGEQPQNALYMDYFSGKHVLTSPPLTPQLLGTSIINSLSCSGNPVASKSKKKVTFNADVSEQYYDDDAVSSSVVGSRSSIPFTLLDRPIYSITQIDEISQNNDRISSHQYNHSKEEKDIGNKKPTRHILDQEGEWSQADHQFVARLSGSIHSDEHHVHSPSSSSSPNFQTGTKEGYSSPQLQSQVQNGSEEYHSTRRDDGNDVDQHVQSKKHMSLDQVLAYSSRPVFGQQQPSEYQKQSPYHRTNENKDFDRQGGNTDVDNDVKSSTGGNGVGMIEGLSISLNYSLPTKNIIYNDEHERAISISGSSKNNSLKNSGIVADLVRKEKDGGHDDKKKNKEKEGDDEFTMITLGIGSLLS